jgi:hypothetical protein
LDDLTFTFKKNDFDRYYLKQTKQADFCNKEDQDQNQEGFLQDDEDEKSDEYDGEYQKHIY